MLIERSAVLDDHERQGLNHAMGYVQRVKTRFINDPDTYNQFLGIFTRHKFITNNNNVSFYSCTLPYANASLQG
jgi:hypothetical protein